MSLAMYQAAYLAGRKYISNPNLSRGITYIQALNLLIAFEEEMAAGLDNPLPSLMESGSLKEIRKSWEELLARLSESLRKAGESLENYDKEKAESSFQIFKQTFSAAYLQEFRKIESLMID